MSLFFTLVTHLGVVLDLVTAVEAIVKEIQASKKFPSASTSEQLLEAIQKLVDSGVIKLPDSIPQAEVDQVFKVLEDWLSAQKPS